MSARTTRRCPSCGRQAKTLVVVRTVGAGPDVRTDPRTSEPVRTTKRFAVCATCVPAARTALNPVHVPTDRTTQAPTGTGRRQALVPVGSNLAGGVA